MDERDRVRDPRDLHVHPLEIPVVWFGFLLAEWALLAPLIWALVPRAWPTAVQVAVWIAALGVVASLNHVIRRRFISR